MNNKFESLRHLLELDRSVRRYDESREISIPTLERLIDLTRYCASGRNMQPLRYRMVVREDEKRELFPLLAWAGYLKDWNGPEEGERPAAYLVQFLDTRYGENCLCDDGLQLQAITLGACALGIGGCIIKAFNQPKVKNLLGLDDHLVPRYVLALGYPAETIEIEDMSGLPDADCKYYRTPDGVHHVPKRPLSELIVE